MSQQGMLKKLSYFEAQDQNGKFVGMFPSTKTSFTSDLPQLGDKVFLPSSQDIEDLSQLTQAMQPIDLGFNDLFWFLPSLALVPDKKTFTVDEILDEMASLYYEPISSTINFGVVSIRSTLFQSFAKNAYIKDTSLPQEAIDSIPIFNDAETQQKFVALGYKKKSAEMMVTFGAKTVALLTTGIYGFVIYGEHLEVEEKKKMDSVEVQAAGKYPFEINEKGISPALRTLLEEGGFRLTSASCRCFYMGKDATKDEEESRDIRYGKIQSEDGQVFGYARSSFSHTVLVLVEGNPPKELNEPVDAKECSKGVIITLEEALKEFQSGGKYKPAFASHVRQLRMCF